MRHGAGSARAGGEDAAPHAREALDGRRAVDATDGWTGRRHGVCVRERVGFIQIYAIGERGEGPRCEGTRESWRRSPPPMLRRRRVDFMKRVGGIDLIVNLAQQCGG